MRIASFNLESLYSRPCVMNHNTWGEGKEILSEFGKLNSILQNESYSQEDKKKILDSIEKLGLLQRDNSKDSPVILRQNKGHLLSRKEGVTEVVAKGRGDWIGWLELKCEAVDETATRMTARVIKDVNADIQAVIEAEDRIALRHFNDQLLKSVDSSYREVMLIDGNDERGIDVGLLTKPGYDITTMVSHVDDEKEGKIIFDRDCPEYTININDKDSILIIINHFKSKGWGSQTYNNARRKAQAKRVREIYDERRRQGIDMIAIVGDFNDVPESEPLSPLLSEDSDLRDISTHPKFTNDGHPGTFSNGTKSQKFDYILLSPALYEKVTGGGVWRRGVWGGRNGTLFEHYEEIEKPENAASDHAAIYADIEL